jgi:hypothetical protein
MISVFIGVNLWLIPFRELPFLTVGLLTRKS